MKENKLFIQISKGYLQINKETIQLIRYENEECLIVTITESYKIKSALLDLETLLDETFIRCHKNFVINTNFIQKWDITESKIILQDGHEVPVSTRGAIKLKRVIKLMLI
jgi:DNA-binding LytR/AlgR family response regulator